MTATHSLLAPSAMDRWSRSGPSAKRSYEKLMADPARRAAHLRKKREYNRRWRALNPDKLRAQFTRWACLPEPAYPAPACCECCGKTPGKRALSLDHDHSTGLFRGWLCTRCNTGIGALGDSVTGLAHAAAYLERHYGR